MRPFSLPWTGCKSITGPLFLFRETTIHKDNLESLMEALGLWEEAGVPGKTHAGAGKHANSLKGPGWPPDSNPGPSCWSLSCPRCACQKAKKVTKGWTIKKREISLSKACCCLENKSMHIQLLTGYFCIKLPAQIFQHSSSQQTETEGYFWDSGHRLHQSVLFPYEPLIKIPRFTLKSRSEQALFLCMFFDINMNNLLGEISQATLFVDAHLLIYS